ncbi:MAG: HlyD family efflux transporter periplasmic adaptor subunit, partial [Candidatus Levybacteria bacterium]|nr:HlyD family efflux transporter periplasmic adaptor subunit [Candidatus Levybacteria bacterium]
KYKDQQTAIAQAQALTSSTWSLYQATQDSTVTSPVSGTITNLSVTKGSTVAIKTISLTGSPTTPALIITSDYKNEISLALSETDVTKVRPGQQAVVKVNAVADKKYQGIVDRVDSVGTNNQGVVTYNTYISLLNGNDMVRQGMTVDVDITTKEIKNVLSVSNSAVKPYKGGRAVRIPDAKAKEKFKYLPVVTGVKGSGRTQIIKGIMEGQEVISTLSNEKIKRPGLFGS